MRVSEETNVGDIVEGSHQRCHVMTSIITLGMVPIEYLVGYGRLKMPMNGMISQQMIKGFEVGVARNMCVEHILKFRKSERPKYLFFYGDDMLPQWDGFVKLYEEIETNKWDCLTGLYYIKGEPPTPLTWRDDHVGRLIPGKHFTVGDVIDVDLTGLDFTLIRTSLLEEMEPPWFKTGPSLMANIPQVVEPYLVSQGVMSHTEDVWFYKNARKLGARIGVHTGVRVGHIDCVSGCIY